MVSLGGALGALLVGIAAPNLLPGYFELGIALVACAALRRGARVFRSAGGSASGSVVVVAATTTLVAINIREYRDDTRVMVRNFYGVVRTRDFAQPVPFRAMYHGGINHGGQLLDAALRNEPSSYFGRTSGYGRTFASLPDAPRRVGIIGLGAGAIAAYSRPGDVFRFYEIDPQVVDGRAAGVHVPGGQSGAGGSGAGRRAPEPGARSPTSASICSRSTPSRAIPFRCIF